jgi:hypothetical protein
VRSPRRGGHDGVVGFASGSPGRAVAWSAASSHPVESPPIAVIRPAISARRFGIGWTIVWAAGALAVLLWVPVPLPNRFAVAPWIAAPAVLGVAIARQRAEIRRGVLWTRGQFNTATLQLRDIQHISNRTVSGGENGPTTAVTVRVGGRTITLAATSRSGRTISDPAVVAFRDALVQETEKAGGKVDDPSPADALRSTKPTEQRRRITHPADGAALATIRFVDGGFTLAWLFFAAFGLFLAPGAALTGSIVGWILAFALGVVSVLACLQSLTATSMLFADRVVIRRWFRRTNIPLSEIIAFSVIATGRRPVPNVEIKIERGKKSFDVKKPGIGRTSNLAALDLARLLDSRLPPLPTTRTRL